MKKIELTAFALCSLFMISCGNSKTAHSEKPVDLDEVAFNVASLKPTSKITFGDLVGREIKRKSNGTERESYIALKFTIKAPRDYYLGYKIETSYETAIGTNSYVTYLAADMTIVDPLSGFKFSLLSNSPSWGSDDEREVEIKIPLSTSPTGTIKNTPASLLVDHDYSILSQKQNLGENLLRSYGLLNYKVTVQAITNSEISEEKKVIYSSYELDSKECSLSYEESKDRFLITTSDGLVLGQENTANKAIRTFNHLIEDENCKVQASSVGKCELISDSSGPTLKYAVKIDGRQITKYGDSLSSAEGDKDALKTLRVCY